MPACLSDSSCTSVAPGNELVDGELLCQEAGSSESDDAHDLVFWVEGERSVEVLLRIESALLHEEEGTLTRRVGSSCLYLRADSLSLKISSKLSAEWGDAYS